MEGCNSFEVRLLLYGVWDTDIYIYTLFANIYRYLETTRQKNYRNYRERKIWRSSYKTLRRLFFKEGRAERRVEAT